MQKMRLFDWFSNIVRSMISLSLPFIVEKCSTGPTIGIDVILRIRVHCATFHWTAQVIVAAHTNSAGHKENDSILSWKCEKCERVPNIPVHFLQMYLPRIFRGKLSVENSFDLKSPLRALWICESIFRGKNWSCCSYDSWIDNEVIPANV